jgi:hypothetical protein
MENRLLSLATQKKNEEDEKLLRLIEKQKVLHSYYLMHFPGEILSH